MDPFRVMYLKHAAESGIGPGPEDPIETVGDSVEDVKPDSFRLPASFRFNKLFTGIFIRLVRRFFWLRPYVDSETCVRCRRCVESCPVKAMTMHQDGIDIDYSACITCLCCHELCDVHAVRLKASLLTRLIFGTDKYEQD
jgi:Pyruvate/2-oxoacid:ferredoxin oxidoreductase delta subunit